ncbi:MAG: hypothetical protein KGI29_00665 [Pseudomonadota bacterium]|nr:hypothetical protein [Pseudomonadota bacterium]MDE3037545.1 hypothetical protein [Pseudomonadota bacterium]
MPFEIIKDTSQFIPINAGEMNSGGMYYEGWRQLFDLRHRFNTAGASVLLMPNATGTHFNSFLDYADRKEKGDRPEDRLFRTLFSKGSSTPKRKGQKPGSEYQRHVERDALTFGDETHRLAKGSLEAIYKLSGCGQDLLMNRPVNDTSSPQKVQNLLTSLNQYATTILSDPNIAYAPEVEQFTKAIYTMVTASAPLTFDDAAEQAGVVLRYKDLWVKDQKKSKDTREGGGFLG